MLGFCTTFSHDIWILPFSPVCSFSFSFVDSDHFCHLIQLFNKIKYCYEVKVGRDLIKSAKAATTKALEEYQKKAEATAWTESDNDSWQLVMISYCVL